MTVAVWLEINRTKEESGRVARFRFSSSSPHLAATQHPSTPPLFSNVRSCLSLLVPHPSANLDNSRKVAAGVRNFKASRGEGEASGDGGGGGVRQGIGPYQSLSHFKVPPPSKVLQHDGSGSPAGAAPTIAIIGLAQFLAPVTSAALGLYLRVRTVNLTGCAVSATGNEPSASHT
jgi:hypothetical protein